MQKVEITYGGGVRPGVTQLMSVGADEYPDNMGKMIRYGELVAMGVWAFGKYTNNAGLSKIGMGAAIALLIVGFAQQQ